MGQKVKIDEMMTQQRGGRGWGTMTRYPRLTGITCSDNPWRKSSLPPITCTGEGVTGKWWWWGPRLDSGTPLEWWYNRKPLLKCVAAQNLPRTILLNPTISCELCTAMTQIFRSLQSKEDERSWERFLEVIILDQTSVAISAEMKSDEMNCDCKKILNLRADVNEKDRKWVICF